MPRPPLVPPTGYDPLQSYIDFARCLEVYRTNLDYHWFQLVRVLSTLMMLCETHMQAH
jgi:hypothetical protein